MVQFLLQDLLLSSCCSQSHILPASLLGTGIMNQPSEFKCLFNLWGFRLFPAMSPLLTNWWAILCFGLHGSWSEVPGEGRAVWDESGARAGQWGWTILWDGCHKLPTAREGTALPVPELVLLVWHGCCGHRLPVPAPGQELTGAHSSLQLSGVGTDLTCGSWLHVPGSFALIKAASMHLFLQKTQSKWQKQLRCSKKNSRACRTKQLPWRSNLGWI